MNSVLKNLILNYRGNEIDSLLIQSCPKDSDEVQNIVISALAAKINGNPIIIYDLSSNGAEAIILLKILNRIYSVDPVIVFSECSDIVQHYTSIKCLETDCCIDWCFLREDIKDCCVMIIGSEYFENRVSEVIYKFTQLGIHNFSKIESELITSMELDFYKSFLQNSSNLQWAYNRMCDNQSKICFLEYIRTVIENDYWRENTISLSYKYWGYDESSKQYLYTHLKDEKWINVGCCNGDTIFRYLSNGYSFSRIYAIDTDWSALQNCKYNLKLLKSIKSIDCISYHNVSLGLEANQISIDETFGDSEITLINMDIEGEEENVLKSASKLISTKHPVLAICAYHRPEDLFSLVNTITQIDDCYSFYLRKYPNYPYHRYNSKEEIVLYAIPPERLICTIY